MLLIDIKMLNISILDTINKELLDPYVVQNVCFSADTDRYSSSRSNEWYISFLGG